MFKQSNIRTMPGAFALLLIAALPSNASALKDGRRLPISRAELTGKILHYPLNSATQIRDLLRASHSGMLNVAYTMYTQVWEKKQQDADANLLRGLAAELYWQDSMDPTQRQQYGLNASREDLFAVAEDCLRRAATAAPRSAEANMEWGYFSGSSEIKRCKVWSCSEEQPCWSRATRASMRRWGLSTPTNPATPIHSLKRLRNFYGQRDWTLVTPTLTHCWLTYMIYRGKRYWLRSKGRFICPSSRSQK